MRHRTVPHAQLVPTSCFSLFDLKGSSTVEFSPFRHRCFLISARKARSAGDRRVSLGNANKKYRTKLHLRPAKGRSRPCCSSRSMHLLDRKAIPIPLVTPRFTASGSPSSTVFPGVIPDGQEAATGVRGDPYQPLRLSLRFVAAEGRGASQRPSQRAPSQHFEREFSWDKRYVWFGSR